MEKKGWLIDADYITENGRAVIRLWCKDENGDTFIVLDDSFQPYFYVRPPPGVKEEDLLSVQSEYRKETVSPVRVEKVKRRELGIEQELFRIYAEHPMHVPRLREVFSRFCEVREADIPFAFRYLIDNNLRCFEGIAVKGERISENPVTIHAENVEYEQREEYPPLKILAFDCEMLNEFGMPDPKKSSIILISIKTDEEDILLEAEDGDKNLILEFVEKIREVDPDVIIGYNQDSFDWPYLRERARLHGIKLRIGRDGSEPKFTGGVRKVDIAGRLNVDLYLVVERDLDIKIKTLDNVAEFFGKKMNMSDIKARDIYSYWIEGKKEEVRKYSLQDAIHTYEIGRDLLPLQYEMCRLIGLPLDEISRMGRGRQVEWLLTRESFRISELIPSKSGDHVTYEGAFVLDPVRDLHENVVCLDFASMYPSIMIAYNISPDTLAFECDDCYVAPEVGHMFRKTPDGFFKRILKSLIDTRREIKEKMKEIPPESEEYRILDIRQQTLKILTNSFYGYTGWSEAKWYRKECAEATAAWGRYFIKISMQKAREMGFSVLYGDTDSLFVKKDSMKLSELVNEVEKLIDTLSDVLPVKLEIDELYRTIFFADKKRYAGLTSDGKIIVKGLEIRRGDWCELAKKIQSRVVEIILRDKSPEKAVEVVRDVINRLKEGDVSVEDVVIYKTLTKKISDYDSMQAHVKAAQKAQRMNLFYHTGSKIGFVIVKGQGSVSDRAYPVDIFEEMKNGVLIDREGRKYRLDIDYYIDNQIIPVALRILGFFGYTTDKLKQKPSQMTLDFFG